MSYIGFGIVHSDQPFTIDEHTGDGTTTVFTLSTPKPVVSRAIIVTIDGVVQDPGALNSYDLDANGDLEFSEPPENLSSIRTLHLGRKYDLAVPMDGSVTPIKMAPDANGDFHFDTDTLYIDYLNDRVGINTSTPQHALDVVGDIHASGNITAGGNITLGDGDTDSVTFNADITSHIIPDADDTYDLGSATKKWRKLYVSGNTIHLGNLELTEDNGGGFTILDNLGNVVNITGSVTGTVSDISNHNLDALGNVSFAVAPTDGQSIIWDNANSQWIAGDSFNQSDFDAAIALKSIDVLSDVDTTSVAPTSGDALVWDGANFVPQAPFSQADFDTAFGNKSTDDLTEGSTNFYYTDERVDDRVADLIVDGVGITKNYDDAGNLLNIAIDFTEFDSDDIIEGSVNTYLASRTTDNIPEGSTNLYYTDDRVNTFLASGAVTEFKSGLFKLENEFAVDDYVADDYTNTFVATIGSGALSADRTITVPDLSGSILLDSSSIGDLSDVNLSTPPTNEQVLVWDAATSKFIPGDAAADFTDLTGQISAGQIPNDIITNAMLNYTVNVFSQEFTADGINNTYTLTSDPGSKNALQIFVDGVPQRASNYTVVGTTLTLGGTPTNGQLVEVRGYGVVQPIGTVADNSITGAKLQDGTIDLSKIAPSDYYTADTFTGDGNTASYTLSTDPGSPYAITVYVAGVWQKPVTNYTVVGTTLTFTSNVANGEEVYVRYYGVALNVGTVADGSITGAKLQDGTIGTAKIEPGAYASQTFTGDNTTTVFTLNNDPGTAQALLVMVDNVIQEPAENYNTSGTTLTFTGPPALDSRIYVRYLGLPSGTANIPADDSVTNAKLNLSYTSNQYTGDGSTTDYTIPAGHNANSLLLILDGSILPPSDYSVSGTTLTFTSPPLLNQSIDIRYMPV